MIFKFSDDDNFHKSVTRPVQKRKSCLIKLEGVDVKMTPGRSRRQNNTWRLILFHSNENQPSTMRELRFGDNIWIEILFLIELPFEMYKVRKRF